MVLKDIVIMPHVFYSHFQACYSALTMDTRREQNAKFSFFMNSSLTNDQMV